MKVIASLILMTVMTVAWANVTIQGGLTQVHSVAIGQEVNAKLTLKNVAQNDVQVKLYLVDYLFQADGSGFYPVPGSNLRSNAAWVSLPQSEVFIPAQGELSIPYSMLIPTDSDLRGTYWSVIMVEQAGTSDAPTTRASTAQQSQVTIRTVQRSAIQIITNIGQDAEPSISFSQPTLVNENASDISLTLSVRNTGELVLVPEFSLDLFNSDGVLISQLQGSKKRIFPGITIPQTFELGHLPVGIYMAIVIADTGGDDVFGARYTLNVTAQSSD